MENLIQKFIKHLISAVLVSSLILNGSAPACAQEASSAQFSLPVFHLGSVMLQGIKIFPDNPLQMDFIVDTGGVPDSKNLSSENEKLVRYFLTALTVPENDLWVNLSPYESNRIIPDALGQTEMGRDLLAQDYILKQLTSSLMHPDGEVGKKFWEKIYSKAYEKLGTTDIPVDTFNKVWIVPEKVEVFQNLDVAYIVNVKMKVMLEEDYLARENNAVAGSGNDDKNDKNRIVSHSSAMTDEARKIIHDVIIPEIENEVNNGESFAPLRQIFHSVILAKWYKQYFKNSLIGQKYADQKKINGLRLNETGSGSDASAVDKIYDQYVSIFKQGVYDTVKEEYDPVTQQLIPKKYFSGGVVGVIADLALLSKMELPSVVKNLRVLRAVFSNSGDNAQLQKFSDNELIDDSETWMPGSYIFDDSSFHSESMSSGEVVVTVGTLTDIIDKNTYEEIILPREFIVRKRTGGSQQEARNVFLRHLVAKILDEYFVLTKRYGVEHVPAVLGLSELGYYYENAEGSEGFPWYVKGGVEDSYRSIPVTLNEYHEVLSMFSAAGVSIGDDATDSNDAKISKNIIAQGVGNIDLMYQGKPFPNTWKRIDFAHPMKFDYQKLLDYIKRNEDPLTEKLAYKAQLLEAAASLLNNDDFLLSEFDELFGEYQKEILLGVTSDRVGGIDLNEFDMDVQGQILLMETGSSVDPAMLRPIQGLAPRIISILKVGDEARLAEFLNLKP